MAYTLEEDLERERQSLRILINKKSALDAQIVQSQARLLEIQMRLSGNLTECNQAVLFFDLNLRPLIREHIEIGAQMQTLLDQFWEYIKQEVWKYDKQRGLPD